MSPQEAGGEVLSRTSWHL